MLGSNQLCMMHHIEAFALTLDEGCRRFRVNVLFLAVRMSCACHKMRAEVPDMLR